MDMFVGKKTDFCHSHNKKKKSFVNNLILPIYMGTKT